MRIISVAQAKSQLSAYLDEAARSGPIVITRNGKAVAVMLAPQDDDQLEEILLTHSKKFQAMLETSRQSIKAGKATTHDAFWQQVGQQ
jgi:prevent-host-death family protein